MNKDQLILEIKDEELAIEAEAFELFCKDQLREKINDAREKKERWVSAVVQLDSIAEDDLRKSFLRGHSSQHSGSIKEHYINKVRETKLL